MGESVILNTPILLLLFGIGLGLCLFHKFCRGKKGWFTLASAVVVVASCTYALILGAGTGEVVTVLLLFLLLGLEGWE